MQDSYDERGWPGCSEREPKKHAVRGAKILPNSTSLRLSSRNRIAASKRKGRVRIAFIDLERGDKGAQRWKQEWVIVTRVTLYIPTVKNVRRRCRECPKLHETTFKCNKASRRYINPRNFKQRSEIQEQKNRKKKETNNGEINAVTYYSSAAWHPKRNGTARENLLFKKEEKHKRKASSYTSEEQMMKNLPVYHSGREEQECWSSWKHSC